MATMDKKAYITEEEFNAQVIARGLAYPTKDSPDDSEKDAAVELDIGVSGVAEDEPDEIIGLTDRIEYSPEPGSGVEQVENSPLPSPRADENSDTSVH